MLNTLATPHTYPGRLFVVEGIDGFGRSYISQTVWTVDGAGKAVPLREPAFWLGFAYTGEAVTGATGWTGSSRSSSSSACLLSPNR